VAVPGETLTVTEPLALTTPLAQLTGCVTADDKL